MAVAGSMLNSFFIVWPERTRRSYCADAPLIARLRVDGHHGRLRKEIELGSTGPRVSPHRAPDDQVARLELGQHEILGNHIDAVAGGPCQHRRQPLGAVPEWFDRIARVIIELTAVRPIESIIEVVPPVTFALGTAH